LPPTGRDQSAYGGVVRCAVAGGPVLKAHAIAGRYTDKIIRAPVAEVSRIITPALEDESAANWLVTRAVKLPSPLLV